MHFGHCTCNLDSCPVCRPLAWTVHAVYPPSYYSGRIAALEGETFALSAKLEQAEGTIREWGNQYAELNVRLAGVEAERDAARHSLSMRLSLRAEIAAALGVDNDADDAMERGLAAIQGLRAERDIAIKLAAVSREVAHDMEADRDRLAERVKWFEASGGVAAHTRIFEVLAERDRLQRVVDNLSHLHLCADHQPDKWESDGTCPLCEGERLQRVVQVMREMIIDATRHEDVAAVGAKLDALLREKC